MRSLLGRAGRVMVPATVRARLRRSGFVNGCLRRVYGGIRSRPHPTSPHTIYFDGYRNIGWSLGGLTKLEHHEFDFAREQLKQLRPECVWDVGANVGLWTLFFAGFEPQIPSIVAFEPDPVNRNLLEMNRSRNAIGNIQIRDCALSDHPGTSRFFMDPLTGSTGTLEQGKDFIGQHYGAQRQELPVTLSTIDAEIASGIPAPQFMKIDVEGHELELLRGAEKTLAEIRPVMLIECSNHIAETTRFLRDRNYRLIDPATGRDLDQVAFMTAAVPA